MKTIEVAPYLVVVQAVGDQLIKDYYFEKKKKRKERKKEKERKRKKTK